MSRQLGRALVTIPNNYTLVDLETTGFSASDKIIEVGCVKIRDNQEVARFQKLINPRRSIPYRVTQVNGIDNRMVARAPTFQQIALELWFFLKDEVIVGHNVQFDLRFLYDGFADTLGLTFSNDFVDTLTIARAALPKLKSHKLDTLCEYFNIAMSFDKDVSARHRAVGDCLLEYLLIKKLSETM